MKKALALLVVLAILAVPVFAMAAPGGPAGPVTENERTSTPGTVTVANYSFYMLPDDAEVEVEEGEVVLPEIVIPAAGSVAAVGVAMILATLGTALLPKK